MLLDERRLKRPLFFPVVSLVKKSSHCEDLVADSLPQALVQGGDRLQGEASVYVRVQLSYSMECGYYSVDLIQAMVVLLIDLRLEK